MKVIELCGNPGCGKSVLTGNLIRALRERGLHAEDYNDVKPGRYWKNLRYLFSWRTIAAAASLFAFGKNVPFRRRLVYSVKCAVIPKQLACWEKAKRTDFVIFDEGIIQYVSTLSHGICLSGSDLRSLAFLQQIYRDARYAVVDCILPISQNIERIRGRARKGDRFVSEDDDEQKRLLTRKRENLTTILQWLCPVCLYTVPMIDGKEENLRELLQALGIE